MKYIELKKKFLDYFKEKNHIVLSSASVFPENDPTVLFTTAGMHPLVPYLLGERHPSGKRLVDVQKCIRTDDIDEVGDLTHHTFFEMLGNWSLGDYFKKESLAWSFEFLTSSQWLGLDKNRLAVSVFAGDQDAPFDEEAFEIWKNLGISEKRIARLPKKNNWWWSAGESGPCGPDSEIFYWTGDLKDIPESFNDDNDLWVEIWNNVFMQYNKNKNGELEILSQKNVDTGMGLERMLAMVNGLQDNYLTEVFKPILNKIEFLSGKKYGENSEDDRAMRIISDHIKAAVFILGDEKGVAPSNNGQGYVLRRLIRRAVRYGRKLNLKFFTSEIGREIIEIYKSEYSELEKNRIFILENLSQEENKFEKTLENGLKEFEKGVDPFVLFSTYGFPIEITKELAKEKGLRIDEEKFYQELKRHQELSRTASAGMFKGGLADTGEQSRKLHTAAHLLLAALRDILGDHVFQKGSNINSERLRLDFSHSEKMTLEQISTAEKMVNEIIEKNLPVLCEEKDLEEAKKQGAMGVFDSKYGERVKIYKIADNDEVFSMEICGGPHAEKTGDLGIFRIIKEEAVSSGVRRIKAVLESK